MKQALKKTRFPHEGVYTWVRASKANPEEAGVFAIIPIKRGANPFPEDDEPINWVSEKELRSLRLPKFFYEIYDRLGAVVRGKRAAPKSWKVIAQSWFIADGGKNANLEYGDDDFFYALRDIKPGEELTVDYKKIG